MGTAPFVLGKTLYLVVLVQTAAIIGGPALNIYLTGAAQTERVGRDRVALALQRVAEDFFLPSPSGPD